MLVRGDDLGKTMSAYLVERIERAPAIDVRLRTEVRRCTRRGRPSARSRSPARTGASGCPPARSSSASAASRGPAGPPEPVSAPTRRATSSRARTCSTPAGGPEGWPLDRDPLALETSVPGLFAAGDVRHGSTKRVAGAVGEGAMAVALAHRRLEEIALS